MAVDAIPLHIRYQKYKVATGIVIEWLQTRSSISTPLNNDGTAARVPVREILHLAQHLSERHVLTPRKIQDAFKSAILNRRRLTEYYEGLPEKSQLSEEATQRHKFFNETLAQAYELLLAEKSNTRSAKKKRPKDTSLPNNHVDDSSRNRFDVLSDIIEEEGRTDSYEFFEQDDGTKASQPFAIEDDPLESILAIHSYIAEIENLINMVKLIWKDVAEGLMTMTLAGWLTNFATGLMRQTSAKYATRYGHHGNFLRDYDRAVHSLISNKFKYAESVEDLACPRPAGHISHDLSLKEGLHWPYMFLLLLRQGINKEENVGEPTLDYLSDYQKRPQPRAKLSSYLRPPSVQEKAKLDLSQAMVGIDRAKEGGSCSSEAARTLRQAYVDLHLPDMLAFKDCTSTLSNTVNPESVVGIYGRQTVETIPLLTEMIHFVRGVKDEVHSSFVFGIHILLESTKGFVWCHENDVPNDDNCRLRTLRLANEIKHEIQATLLLEHDPLLLGSQEVKILDAFDAILIAQKKFLSSCVFDFYNQTPWVAGSTMATMLGEVQTLGMASLNNDGMFGSLLHLYNMVQQVGPPCPKIPLLEELCDLFAKQVFLGDGQRRTKNFSSLLQIFLGGSLQYDRCVGPYIMPDRKRCFVSALSKNARINVADMSMFVNQTLADYMGGEQFFAQLESDGKRIRYERRKGAHRTIDNLFGNNTLPELIDKARKLLEREFSGPLPVSKINYLKLFRTVCEFWKELTRRHRMTGGIPKELSFDQHRVPDGTILSGLSLLTYTAYDVDARMKSKRGKPTADLKDHSALIIMRDALVKVFENTTFEEFLWQEL